MMNKILSNLIYKIKRNIKLKSFIKFMLMLIQFPVVFIAFFCSRFLPSKLKNSWLIGETGSDAKDNGLAFFSYLTHKHPEINTVYYIKGHSKAETHVKSVGPTLLTNSFKHKVVFMSAKYILSTHDGYSIPFYGSNWREFKVLYGWLNPQLKFVFLNHGVNKDDIVSTSNYLLTKFDYLVTTTDDEFREMSNKKYGYPVGNVVKTGLARYDTLFDKKNIVNNQKSIVFMPTWRYYLADIDDEQFVKSLYFKKIFSFLHNDGLKRLLIRNGVKLYFFPPHHEIQKRIPLFELENDVIQALDTEETDFAEVLLRNSMMVTDYSSVVFDFAYLEKISAYYQFDLEQYRSGHYKAGYFQYEKDGFGPICFTEDEIIDEIANAIDNNFEVAAKYKKRIKRTFSVIDNQNSERLFRILQ